MTLKIDERWQGRSGLVQDDHLTVSVNSDLKAAIQAAAEEADVSASYWMREAAIGRLEGRLAERTG